MLERREDDRLLSQPEGLVLEVVRHREQVRLGPPAYGSCVGGYLEGAAPRSDRAAGELDGRDVGRWLRRQRPRPAEVPALPESGTHALGERNVLVGLDPFGEDERTGPLGLGLDPSD